MPSQKLTGALWFSGAGGDISNIINYYQQIFGENVKAGTINDLGETPSGKTQMCEVSLFGQSYSVMCTEKEHQPFNDSFALIILCKDQEEIDAYWNYFTREGKESQCGWCQDKFGLRWQIIPENFGALMAKPNAWQVMMKQKKIIINEY